ncbi:hypothetical protein A0J61_01767 [Choanephora cucurbitarum]|uniref:Uncharacterized protein n=1 Tax=Choanephora cucurbitarum TaxID=101091 RepID=A0A1C7NMT8_9FUNG|nr:hypothetical protein A0J61_01767 [Choanephora cucurbitarum]
MSFSLVLNKLGFDPDIKLLSAYYLAGLFIYSELIVQLVVVITESISNSEYKRFPPNRSLVGYTGQSLLVIIVSIVQISVCVLVIRNLGYVISKSLWKITLGCIGISVGSICFRIFSSWFLQSQDDPYYIVTYNITSICLIVGAALWIPFAFCRSQLYIPPSSEDDPRSNIRSTNGPRPVYRPNNEETEDDELPSYYEMAPPPSYKKAIRTSQNSSQPTVVVHTSGISEEPTQPGSTSATH